MPCTYDLNDFFAFILFSKSTTACFLAANFDIDSNIFFVLHDEIWRPATCILKQ